MLYELATASFTVADLRRLDGFHARCIRVIMGISPSYVSRISNAEVLQRAGCQKLSESLKKRQLKLLGSILREPEGGPRKAAAFIPNTKRPATDRYVRRIGRPSKEWVPTILAEARRLTEGEKQLETLSSDKHRWNTFIDEKLR